MGWRIEIDRNKGDEEAILFLNSKLAEVIIWVDKNRIETILQQLDEDADEIKLGYCGNEPAFIVVEKKSRQVIVGDKESWDVALTLSQKELEKIQKVLSAV